MQSLNKKNKKRTRSAERQSNAIAAAIQPLEKRIMMSFTPGDLVVYRVGTGSSALNGNATAVSLDEYSTSANQSAPVYSVALPTATSGSNNPLTATGTGTTEGEISLTEDGKYLLVPGYDAVPGVSNVASTVATAQPTTGGITASINGPLALLYLSTTSPSKGSNGMVSGQQITVSHVGNVPDGTYYLSVVSSTAINLYSNAALTTPVAASGTFNPNGTATWTDSSITSTPRDVGIVSANGTVDTSTTFGTNGFTGTAIHGVAAVSGVNGTSKIYGDGVNASGSVLITTAGSTATSTSVSTSTVNNIAIVNNQLYAAGTYTSGTTVAGIGMLGTGLPTSGSNTIADLPSLPAGAAQVGLSTSAYQFALATLGTGSSPDVSPDTVYVADYGNYGVDKFTYSTSTSKWVFSGEIGGGSGGQLASVTGLIAEPTAGGEQLYFSTPTNIYSYVDTTGAGGTIPTNVTLTTVATAAKNEAFRGISFAPAEPSIGAVTASAASVATGGSFSLSATNVAEAANGSGTVSSVKFYLETTAGTESASDTLVGSGVQSGSTWTLASVTAPSSAGPAVYYAVATDSNGATSGVGSAPSVTVAVAAPSVGSISTSSSTVNSGSSTTLTLSNVAAYSTDTVSSVNFYAQVGTSPNPATDTLLGAGTASGSTYTLNFTPSALTPTPLAAGTYTIYAVATSAASVSSGPSATTSLTVATPTFAFAKTSVSYLASTPTASLTVTRSGDTADAATVTYATANGTGTYPGIAGTNYTSTSGTLNFAANQPSATISVPLLAPSGQIGDKDFTVTLTPPSSNALQSTVSASGATQTVIVNQTPRAFTPGDTVVYRTGAGLAVLDSSATAVYLDEYSPAGTLVQSIAMPTGTTSANPLTAAGTGYSEGELTVSADGKELLVPGYDATPGLSGVVSTNSSPSGVISAAANATTGLRAAVFTTPTTTGIYNLDPITVTGLSSNGVSSSTTYYADVLTSTTFSLFTSAATNATLLTLSSSYTGTTATWTDSSLVPTVREVGIVSSSGTIDTSTTLGNSLAGKNITTAAAPTAGGTIYAGGGLGVVSTSTDSTANPTLNDSTDTIDGLEVYRGNLYATNAKTSTSAELGNLGSVPIGYPLSLSNLAGIVGNGNSLGGLGGGDQFAFASLQGGSTPDTLYIADNYNDGIDKYCYLTSDNKWHLIGEIGAYVSGQTSILTGVTGIVAQATSSGEQLFITTDTVGQNNSNTGELYTVTDPYGFDAVNPGGAATGVGTNAGGIFSSTPPLTALGAAPANEAFRGVAFVPEPSLAISTNLPTSQTVATGTTVNLFTSVYGGTNEQIQWQVNTGSGWSSLTNNVNDGNGVVTGVTLNTLTITGATISTPAYQYRALFTNAQGGTVTSYADTLNIVVAPTISKITPAGGNISTTGQITITGANFVSGDTVTIGGASATNVVYVNSSTLTCYYPVPMSAGTYTAVITSPGGVQSPSTTGDLFTYAPAPTVTSISPTTGLDSGGTTVTITGTNFIAAGLSVSFGGVAATASQVTFVSSTQITVVAPADQPTPASAVDVIVTDAGGTSTAVSGDQFTYTGSTIAAVEASTQNKVYTLDDNPVITAILSTPGVTNGVDYKYWAFLVNDGTGSLEVYGTLPSSYTPVVGNAITVTGTYAAYNQIPELNVTSATAAISTISTGNTVAGPISENISSINQTTLPQSIAGYEVTLTGVDIVQNGSNPLPSTWGTQNITATITDSSYPNGIELYYWPNNSYSAANAFFDGLSVPDGSPVSLTGIVDVFNNRTVEFLPISEVGTEDVFTMTTNTSTTDPATGSLSADGFSYVQRGSAITVTVNRTQTSDPTAATVQLNLTDDSGLAGTDYTDPTGTYVAPTAGVIGTPATATTPAYYSTLPTPGGYTQTLTFPQNQSQESFTIYTTGSPPLPGDKLFSLDLASASEGTGYLPLISSQVTYTENAPNPTSVVIYDPKNYDTVSENSINENATIGEGGPATSGSPATYTGTVAVENSTSSAPSLGVLTFDDTGSDPSDLLDNGGVNNGGVNGHYGLPQGNTIETIDGIELETVAAPISSDYSGDLNVYIVASTPLASSYTTNGLTGYQFLTTGTDLVEGMGTQFGSRYLLGQITYNDNQTTNGYTPYNLTNLDPTGAAQLATDLSDGTPFSIVVAPGDKSVGASWAGLSSTADYQSPILRVDYGTSATTNPNTGAATPASLPQYVTATIPKYASSAVWIAPTATLSIIGPTTITADPDPSEATGGSGTLPNIYATDSLASISGFTAATGFTGPTGANPASVDFTPEDANGNPTNVGDNFHIGGLDLEDGATATVTSLGDNYRTANNHSVLVIGSVNGATPTFKIDLANNSKLDLEDNDMIIHEFNLNDAGLQADYTAGRDSGAWDGDGLTSSVADNLDNNYFHGTETVALGMDNYNDLGQVSGMTSWNVDGKSEPFSTDGNDVIVKYTYVGDVDFDGTVGDSDVGIQGGYYGNTPSTGQNTWCFGDTDNSGTIDDSDIGVLGGFYGNGTADPSDGANALGGAVANVEL